MYLSTLSLLAQTTAPAAPASLFSNPIIPFACMAVIFYFLLIRPQQKKQKELQSLIASIKTGDRVVTTGGIHGTVSNVKEGNTLSLKVADNVKIEVDKSAIATVNRTIDAAATVVPV